MGKFNKFNESGKQSILNNSAKRISFHNEYVKYAKQCQKLIAFERLIQKRDTLRKYFGIFPSEEADGVFSKPSFYKIALKIQRHCLQQK